MEALEKCLKSDLVSSVFLYRVRHQQFATQVEFLKNSYFSGSGSLFTLQNQITFKQQSRRIITDFVQLINAIPVDRSNYMEVLDINY